MFSEPASTTGGGRVTAYWDEIKTNSYSAETL